MKAALFIAAAIFAGCARPTPVGTQPTQLIVKKAGAEEQAQPPEREKMRVQSPHADVASRDEIDGNGKQCATNRDCAGRLRCVAYQGVAGRELRQCLFSCLEGCPDGWTCQTKMADGPNYTCQQTR